MGTMVIGGGVPSGGESYCSGTTWETSDDFWLDFDHTTSNVNACVTGDSTETGTLTNATIATPVLESPISGGDAILADGDEHYITYDNTTSYFTSQYGTITFTFKIASDSTNGHKILRIFDVWGQDHFYVNYGSNGYFSVFWEDHNSNIANITNFGVDLDGHDDEWVQVKIIWDTTRCSAEPCTDAGEDELCATVRVDDNSDGDFDDGGAEDWAAWRCETDQDDFLEWDTEPGENDITFGLYDGTQVEVIYVDDLEISNSQPSWP